jgi:hypothetical protein
MKTLDFPALSPSQITPTLMNKNSNPVSRRSGLVRRVASAFALLSLVSIVSAATVNGTLDKDVAAKEHFPTTNYGTDTNIQVSAQATYGKIIYVQFTVSGIPAGSTGISAQLKLRSQTTGTGRSITAHPVSSTSWTETGLTWTNKPALGSALSTVTSHTSGSDSVWSLGSTIAGDGTYAFGLDGTFSGDTTFTSREGGVAPVLVVTYTAPTTYTVYAGNTHSHTNYTSSHGDQVTNNDPSLNGRPIEHFNLAKTNGYDFYVTTDHSQEVGFDPTSATNAAWVDSKQDAGEATVSTFVGLTGFEYSENNGPDGTGHINVINTNTYLDALETGQDLPTLYNWLKTVAPNTTTSTGPVVATFNHPTTTQYNNWGYRDGAITDIITMLEVINSNDNIHETAFQAALAAGWKVSPVAGNDNHGFWGISHHTSRTFVLATARTKAAILDAMKNRRTYASLEKNLSASYTCNSAIMGSTLGSPTTFNFAITVSDPDTADKITKIEILKPNGTGATVAASATFNANSVTWNPSITDSTSSYFYVRIYNATGGDAGSANPANPVAWLAPIWTGR